MRDEIGTATVLGFIPTTYPSGVVLYERWNSTRQRIVRGTALVEDIDSYESELFNRIDRDNLEQATRDLITRHGALTTS